METRRDNSVNKDRHVLLIKYESKIVKELLDIKEYLKESGKMI